MIVNKKSYHFFQIFSDLIVLFISLFCTLYYYHHRVTLEITSLTIILSFVWLIAANSFKLYDDFRSRDFVHQLVSIFKTFFVLSIFLVIVYFLTKERFINRTIIFIYLLSSMLMVVIKDYLLHKIMLYFRKHGKNVRNVILIGGGYLGEKYFKTVNDNPEFGYNIIGVHDDKKSSSFNGEYLGKIDELESTFKNFRIDEVIIALPGYTSEKLLSVVKLANRYGKRTRIIPDYNKYLSKKFEISIFQEFPIITLRTEPLDEIQNRIIKRIFDIVFSFFVLIFILSWLYPIIYVLNIFFSPGPVLFMQDRIGRNNKIFKAYKFRSMFVENSKNRASFRAVCEEDKRITPLGKLLRKSNIDELPQFINVLKGDMSIVGPRPHAIAWHDKYAEYVEEIQLRHRVKPGITGWAQIHGLRGDVEDEEENKKRTRKRIQFDLWYIENWSFLLDIQIIIKTVWNMLKGDPNAY